MFPIWRFQLKEAQTAISQGKLEEALRIVQREKLENYGPGGQLQQEIAQAFATRGVNQAIARDFNAAWADLKQALEIAGETSHYQQAKTTVLGAELAAVQQSWQAGDFRQAWTRIEILEKRQLAGFNVQALKEVSRRLDSARKLAARGKFAEAEEQYVAADAIRGDLASVKILYEQCRLHHQRSQQLEEQLHRALGAEDWSAVLLAADQLLAIAPEFHLARDARRRAWGEVGANIGETNAYQPKPVIPADDADAGPRAPRFILWIDAVGGYLVCLGDELILGQAQPHGEADIPLQADISRKHLRLKRDSGGYLLEPFAPVQVNGKSIAATVLLHDGDIIELGSAVRMKFCKPHALSASAKLEFISRHRTQPFTDAVVLMAESCVLGPKSQNHVHCRQWSGDVVFFRQQDELFCRGMESLEVDGVLSEGRCKLNWNSSIAGDTFAMKLEPL
jgi:tetratricopeptide (TPR) repeat protein